MARLTDNQKLGIVSGVAVLLCGLGGAGIWWAKGLVQEKQDVIAQMKTEITAAKAKIAKIPDVEEDVIILRENLYEYVKILPEQSELNDFLRVTNQFVSQSGVHLTQFVPGRGGGTASKNSPFQRWTYKFKLEATLWQFMHFMSLFENYERFIQVTDFALTSGATRDRRGATLANVVHSITMTVETYEYQALAKSKDVSIANYAHKVEKLREEIFEARQTIAQVGYKFDGDRGRRDIFIDPRESSGSRSNGLAGPSPREQRKIIDTQRVLLESAQSVFRRLQDPKITIFDRYALQRRLEQELGELGRAVEDARTKGLISHAPLKLSWNREVIEPFDQLQKTASASKEQETDRWLSAVEMRGLLDRMKDDLVSGDIRGAVERYDMVEERIRVPTTDERYPMYTRIEGLYLRAKLAEEFSALALDISGILVNDIGKSGVILNGAVYEEGEYVDNNLLIKAVGRERIEFVYKGFTVVKTL